MNDFNLNAFKIYYKIFFGFFCAAFLLGVLFSTSFLCEECKKKEESVSQNLIKHGYKICDSCYTAKTIFPV